MGYASHWNVCGVNVSNFLQNTVYLSTYRMRNAPNQNETFLIRPIFRTTTIYFSKSKKLLRCDVFLLPLYSHNRES